MPGRPLRFVHASDFHLERPLGGVAEVPDQLRDVFIDAAYMAARRVFDTVLAEEADFLVLSGGILTAKQSGPRGPLFLGEQFARLAARGMLVYWAGSEIDPPEAWPGGFPSPGNVRLFPRGRAAEYVHERDGAALARVVGVSRDGQRPLRPGDFARIRAGFSRLRSPTAPWKRPHSKAAASTTGPSEGSTTAAPWGRLPICQESS